ncbi:hypothetical protein [Gracilibacillus dipsosauri]|uniref:hypothetical protein n=1 Tax=Gracilibacillus dipsosauri TaxID=178340 RepID=UPI0024096536
MEHLQSSINEFQKVAESQEFKGLKKYGKPVYPLDNYDWLDMANEEIVDAFKYLHAERVKRKHIAREIRLLIKEHPYEHKINSLLMQLEGDK